jgi:hypothetical protein
LHINYLMVNFYKNLICALIFLLPLTLFAQQTISTESTEVIHFEKKANPGTYQFIVSIPDSEFIFTNDILIQIEHLRKDKEEVIVPVNSFVKVRILSREEILSGDFKPVNEIVYREK